MFSCVMLGSQQAPCVVVLTPSVNHTNSVPLYIFNSVSDPQLQDLKRAFNVVVLHDMLQ